MPKSKKQTVRITRPARTSVRRHWSDDMKSAYRRAIAMERTTYAKIAHRLKLTPQTVWAQLNQHKVKAWTKRAKRIARGRARKR